MAFEKKALVEVEPPVQSALVLLCEKCGKKLAPPEQSMSREFQKELKHRLSEEFGKHVARAMVSSCMDVCPEGEITVAVSDIKNGSQFFTFQPDSWSTAREEIVVRVRALIKS